MGPHKVSLGNLDLSHFLVDSFSIQIITQTSKTTLWIKAPATKPDDQKKPFDLDPDGGENKFPQVVQRLPHTGMCACMNTHGHPHIINSKFMNKKAKTLKQDMMNGSNPHIQATNSNTLI